MNGKNLTQGNRLGPPGPSHPHGLPRCSKTALRAFVKAQACPSTDEHRLPYPGYVIAHINPLACGGAYDLHNMQWQTREDANAKNRGVLKTAENRK